MILTLNFPFEKFPEISLAPWASEAHSCDRAHSEMYCDLSANMAVSQVDIWEIQGQQLRLC